MVQIPVSFKDKSANFQLTIDLNNVNVILRIFYLIRVEKFFFEITAGDYNLKSIPLITNWLLLDKHKSEMPVLKGDFLVRRISDEIDAPILTYDNFGEDWGFFYLSQQEVVDFKNSIGII